MKLGKSLQHKKPNMDDNLVPLINIVFLMLIFFMVAGQISQSDPIKVQAPSSISDTHEQAQPVVLVMASDGQLAFEGSSIVHSELEKAISDAFDSVDDKQAFSLLLKVDANLAIEELHEVLATIKQTGIKRIALATQKSSDVK